MTVVFLIHSHDAWSVSLYWKWKEFCMLWIQVIVFLIIWPGIIENTVWLSVDQSSIWNPFRQVHIARSRQAACISLIKVIVLNEDGSGCYDSYRGIKTKRNHRCLLKNNIKVGLLTMEKSVCWRVLALDIWNWLSEFMIPLPELASTVGGHSNVEELCFQCV